MLGLAPLYCDSSLAQALTSALPVQAGLREAQQFRVCSGNEIPSTDYGDPRSLRVTGRGEAVRLHEVKVKPPAVHKLARGLASPRLRLRLKTRGLLRSQSLLHLIYEIIPHTSEEEDLDRTVVWSH